MDQCSYRHDIPSALQATPPNRPGHDLAVGISHSFQSLTVLTDQRLDDQRPAAAAPTPATPR
jgi:hypothetical protein